MEQLENQIKTCIWAFVAEHDKQKAIDGNPCYTFPENSHVITALELINTLKK